MKRKLYTGLGVLLLLIIGVSVVMLTRTTDTEPKKVYIDVEPSKVGSSDKLSETKKFSEWFEKEKTTLVSNDSEQVKGNKPDMKESDKTPDWNSLTPEQHKHIYNQFYVQFGLEVPPRGYTYDWKHVGVPYLDKNGKPVLRRIDEPSVRVRYGIGFAPTKEEYEKYDELMFERGVAEGRGEFAKVKRLQAEMDAIEASAQRMRPLTVYSTSIGAEAESKSDRLMTEAFNAALREYGLAHLITPWD